MQRLRRAFRVETRKVQIVFICVAVVTFAGLVISSLIGRVKEMHEILLASGAFSLALLTCLWVYGQYRMFRFEWRLYEDGVQILKDNRQIRFVSWEDVTKIKTDNLVIFTRDSSKLRIPLPKHIQHEMQKEIRNIMNEKNLVCIWTYPLLSRERFKRKDAGEIS